MRTAVVAAWLSKALGIVSAAGGLVGEGEVVTARQSVGVVGAEQAFAIGAGPLVGGLAVLSEGARSVRAMPSLRHELLAEVFRARPAFAAELLAEQWKLTLPEHDQVRLVSGQITASAQPQTDAGRRSGRPASTRQGPGGWSDPRLQVVGAAVVATRGHHR